MEDFAIVAQKRADLGTAATRRLRRSGLIPGVIYGAGKDAVSLQLDGNTLRKQCDNEAFFSHILSVDVEGQKDQAVVKALQRAPATGDITHIDLQRVSSDVELTMNVPLHFINEETCIGRKAGGIINHLALEVEIACLPKDLPAYIEVDMASLDIGFAVHLSGLALPPGVRLTVNLEEGDQQDHAVVNVVMPQALDLGEEGEEEGEAVEGEAAEAPAAEPTEE